MKENILIVDDEEEIAELVGVYLKNEGFTVLICHNGADALACVEREEISLAVLDVMLPDTDGFTLCRKIREQHLFPIVMLTARIEDIDKITGLTIGADDYITKPFNPMEVMARVKSQLRRYTMLGSLQTEQVRRPKVLTIGGVMLDDESKSVQVDGEPVTLTPTEYSILKLLMQNAGQVFSTAQIYAAVWKEDACGNDSTVAVHIRHLREKIEITPAEPRYVKVVWGQGYKFEKGGKTT